MNEAEVRAFSRMETLMLAVNQEFASFKETYVKRLENVE